jgi:hypothetical protein
MLELAFIAATIALALHDIRLAFIVLALWTGHIVLAGFGIFFFATLPRNFNASTDIPRVRRFLRTARGFLYQFASTFAPHSQARTEKNTRRENTSREEAPDGKKQRRQRRRAVVLTVDRAERILKLDRRQSYNKDDISTAYKAAMRTAHPDMGGSHEQAAQINQAKDILNSLYSS